MSTGGDAYNSFGDAQNPYFRSNATKLVYLLFESFSKSQSIILLTASFGYNALF
jgi:hypothetical protein